MADQAVARMQYSVITITDTLWPVRQQVVTTDCDSGFQRPLVLHPTVSARLLNPK